MRVFSTSCCAIALAGAFFLALSGPVSAGPEGGDAPECTFRGEVVRAQEYARVLLFQGGDRQQRVPVRRYTPLFPGDVLRVIGNQRVLIRDTPGGRTRSVTAGDGDVVIGTPESCELPREWRDVLSGVWYAVVSWAEGPIAAEPRVTAPRTRGLALSGIEIALALAPEQWLSADLERIAIFWHGPDARVILAGSAAAPPAFEAASSGNPWVSGTLTRLLVAGEELQLALIPTTGTVTRTVRVAAPEAAPLPPGIASLDRLSAQERSVYAIWLAVEGPPEWRLQGLSLLGAAAETDYMAWKIWRGLIAERWSG